MRTLWPFRSGGVAGATSGVDGAVLTSAQTLDSEQQAQVRENIGAASSAATPAFYATLNDGTAVTSSFLQLVGADMTEVFNIGGVLTNGRFTPGVAGYYQFTVRLKFNLTTRPIAALYKNGSLSSRVIDSSGQFIVTGSGILYLDENDYVDLYLYSGVSTTVSNNGPEFGYWSALLL